MFSNFDDRTTQFSDPRLTGAVVQRLVTFVRSRSTNDTTQASTSPPNGVHHDRPARPASSGALLETRRPSEPTLSTTSSAEPSAAPATTTAATSSSATAATAAENEAVSNVRATVGKNNSIVLPPSPAAAAVSTSRSLTCIAAAVEPTPEPGPSRPSRNRVPFNRADSALTPSSRSQQRQPSPPSAEGSSPTAAEPLPTPSAPSLPSATPSAAATPSSNSSPAVDDIRCRCYKTFFIVSDAHWPVR